jgi:hypothetical protein
MMRSQIMKSPETGSAFVPRRLLASGGLELDTKLQFALLTLRTYADQIPYVVVRNLVNLIRTGSA